MRSNYFHIYSITNVIPSDLEYMKHIFTYDDGGGDDSHGWYGDVYNDQHGMMIIKGIRITIMCSCLGVAAFCQTDPDNQ